MPKGGSVNPLKNSQTWHEMGKINEPSKFNLIVPLFKMVKWEKEKKIDKFFSRERKKGKLDD